MSNKALFLHGVKGEWKVSDRPVPSVRDGMILVRAHAVALNPIENVVYERGYVVKEWPCIVGADACGIVEAVGNGVSGFKVGDRVAGHAIGLHHNDHDESGFQQHLLLTPSSTGHIPKNLTLEQGAAIPLALCTAAGALREVGVNVTGSPVGPQSGTKAVLIWGGASTVGMAAIQLAKAAGATVFTTASPRNHALMRQLGADYVFDYRSDSIVDELRAAAREAGLDNGATIEKAVDAAAADIVHTGNVVHALGGNELAYTAGTEFADQMNKGIKSYFAGARNALSDPAYSNWLFHDYMGPALASGKFVPANVEILPGGLDGIPAGLAKLKAGVSATKLVLQI